MERIFFSNHQLASSVFICVARGKSVVKNSSKTARLVRIAIVIALGALAGWMYRSRQTQTLPPLAIQDGKTIDFSSGKPIVKDSAKEKAIIANAVKEMEEATKNVTFAPTATAAK